MRKVLILDDNADILNIVTEVLTYENFDVRGIKSGAELLPLAEAFKPDLILLDLRLADAHGGQLCRKLKDHPSFSDTPVIIFTAYLKPVAELEAYGCDAVIAKPFDLEL